MGPRMRRPRPDPPTTCLPEIRTFGCSPPEERPLSPENPAPLASSSNPALTVIRFRVAFAERPAGTRFGVRRAFSASLTRVRRVRWQNPPTWQEWDAYRTTIPIACSS